MKTNKTSKVVNTQVGCGYLELKNGKSGRVSWEINQLDTGEIASGYVTGDKRLIRAAARDKWAKLSVTPKVSVAVAIKRCHAGKASFTGLLTSWDVPHPTQFEAQMILGLEPAADGTQVVIQFADHDGRRQAVVIPVEIIRDTVPHLEKIVASDPGAWQAVLCRVVNQWRTASAEREPLIYVQLNNDAPRALAPKVARDLAAELVERANEVESRPISVH